MTAVGKDVNTVFSHIQHSPEYNIYFDIARQNKKKNLSRIMATQSRNRF